ncbi:MAG: acyl-CoA synthetase, partial [Dehalococcoidia bacterium]
ELIRREISKINQVLPERIKIWCFVNLPKEFDPDEAEVTRTRKIRRAFIEERYADIKGAIYGNIDEFVFETPVTYQDGRKAIVKNVVKINPID